MRPPSGRTYCHPSALQQVLQQLHDKLLAMRAGVSGRGDGSHPLHVGRAPELPMVSLASGCARECKSEFSHARRGTEGSAAFICMCALTAVIASLCALAPSASSDPSKSCHTIVVLSFRFAGAFQNGGVLVESNDREGA